VNLLRGFYFREGDCPDRYRTKGDLSLFPSHKAGGFLFVSGQIPSIDDCQFVSGGIAEQTEQVMKIFRRCWVRPEVDWIEW